MVKMSDGELSGTFVVQNDVGDTIHVLMPRYGHYRKRQIFLVRRIDGDQSFYRAGVEKVRILRELVCFMTMTGGEPGVSLL